MKDLFSAKLYLSRIPEALIAVVVFIGLTQAVKNNSVNTPGQLLFLLTKMY